MDIAIYIGGPLPSLWIRPCKYTIFLHEYIQVVFGLYDYEN